jgi:hypothetical protein
MSDVLTALAIAAVAVTGLSLLMARLIPDHYDRWKPEPVRRRQPKSSA